MKMTQRVALLSLHSSPLAALGGTDVGGMNLYVRRLAEGLAASGFQADVFTRRTDPLTPEIVDLVPGARVVHLAAGPARPLAKSVLPLHVPAMVNGLAAFVDRERVRFDVIHTHYWLSGLAGLRYLAQTGQPIPLVHMFHTLSKLKELYLGQCDRNDSALRYDGERCVLGRADVIVGATEGEADEMASLYGRKPARYVVIPPGVDRDLFRPLGREASRRELGINARQVILFVGRSDPIKGLDVLLRAVASFPHSVRSGLKVLVVGGTVGSGVRRTTSRLGLDSIVEFRTKVSHTELPRFYSAADVCAVPSAYESFGMVALEAMACQTPVVAFRVGGLASLIKDGSTGSLADPGRPDAYARELLAAMTSDKLESYGRRARMTAQRYTWDVTVGRTLDLYDDLVREESMSAHARTATR